MQHNGLRFSGAGRRRRLNEAQETTDVHMRQDREALSPLQTRVMWRFA